MRLFVLNILRFIFFSKSYFGHVIIKMCQQIYNFFSKAYFSEQCYSKFLSDFGFLGIIMIGEASSLSIALNIIFRIINKENHFRGPMTYRSRSLGNYW